MNNLELVNRYLLLSGLTSRATAVTGQPTDIQRVVAHIGQAWEEIQGSKVAFRFLHDTFTFNTVVDQKIYSGLPSDYKNQSKKDFLVSEAPDGSKGRIAFIPYDIFRLGRNLIEPQSGRPTIYTIAEDDSIEFRANTDQIYTITGEYYKQPVQLVANTDIPNIDTALHIMIVYKALIDFGVFEEDTFAFQAYTKKYKAMYKKFTQRYQPAIRLGNSITDRMDARRTRRFFSSTTP